MDGYCKAPHGSVRLIRFLMLGVLLPRPIILALQAARGGPSAHRRSKADLDIGQNGLDWVMQAGQHAVVRGICSSGHIWQWYTLAG